MDIEKHSRARQIELGQTLTGCRKVYLDARYWIILRDTALGTLTDPAARKLLHHLRRAVAARRIICPISASMFLELMKQRYSQGRRIGTAKLIDELSLGVSMIPPTIMMGTEIHSFLLGGQRDVDLYEMQELLWTKVAYVLGDTYPRLDQLSPSDELEVQKAFFDHLWDCSLSMVVETIGDQSWGDDRFTALSQETNEKNAYHKDELRSFPQTYDIELRGVIEVAGDIAADVIHHLAEKEAGRKLLATNDERATTVNMCRNLLYRAFKKPETKKSLRCLHIGASIHAAMRWDKGRKFKPNDYYDIQHATAALAYCDVFLTESSLHYLVTRPQISLESINSCRVFSDLKAATEYVRKIASE